MLTLTGIATAINSNAGIAALTGAAVNATIGGVTLGRVNTNIRETRAVKAQTSRIENNMATKQDIAILANGVNDAKLTSMYNSSSNVPVGVTNGVPIGYNKTALDGTIQYAGANNYAPAFDRQGNPMPAQQKAGLNPLYAANPNAEKEEEFIKNMSKTIVDSLKEAFKDLE